MGIRMGSHAGGFGRRAATWLLSVTLIPVWGCPGVSPGPFPTDFEDGNVDESVSSPLGKTSGEPNDDFSIPVVAVLDSSGVARLKGTVSSRDDLDVYLLGPLSGGDRIIVDAEAVGSLDVTIAVFDGEGRLASENDDRSATNLDARIDFVIRHDSEEYFVVVTRSAFAASTRMTGTYTATIQVIAGGEVPPPVPQVLYLKFDGGTLNSPQLGRMELAPFSGSAISRIYSGETQTIKDSITAVVRQNYERFDVIVVTSDDFTPEPDDEFSTIYFGGFDETTFGIAENVDLYNADFCDDAIIYSESFSPFLFSSAPSAEEMGVAIGNVASHEAGHLVGLNHVSDDFDVMDDVSPADSFLLDQEFKESVLSEQIVPIGTQDGALLLFETVGPAAAGTMKSMEGLWSRKSGIEPVIGGVEIVKRPMRSAKPKQ